MLIIFDLDGTLFQTEYSTISAVEKLGLRFGVKPVSDTSVTGNIGKTTTEFLAGVFPRDKITDEMTDYFRAIECEEVRKCGKLYPAALGMIDNLKKRGHSLYICTNGSDEYAGVVLESTKIIKYFDGIKSAKYCGSKSKALENILKGAKNAVFVGDTAYDVEAAKANHIPSIAVTYGYGKADELAGATFFADAAGEIEGHIAIIDVFHQITQKLICAGKRIIGINGIDTSGKTLFTRNFARFLSARNIKNQIVHMDDFHNPFEIRRKGENEIDAYYHNAFNYEKIISEILEPLRKTGRVDKEILCLDLDTDKYENNRKYSVDEETVLLIEGVLLFRPPIAEYLDGKIFIHIDFDEALRRAAARDVPKYGAAFLEKYKTKYIPIQKRYLMEYEPKNNCDILIDNNDYYNPGL